MGKNISFYHNEKRYILIFWLKLLFITISCNKISKINVKKSPIKALPTFDFKIKDITIKNKEPILEKLKEIEDVNKQNSNYKNYKSFIEGFIRSLDKPVYDDIVNIIFLYYKDHRYYSYLNLYSELENQSNKNNSIELKIFKNFIKQSFTQDLVKYIKNSIKNEDYLAYYHLYILLSNSEELEILAFAFLNKKAKSLKFLKQFLTIYGKSNTIQENLINYLILHLLNLKNVDIDLILFLYKNFKDTFLKYQYEDKNFYQLAIEQKKFKTLSSLMKLKICDLDHIDLNGYNIFHYVAKYGTPEIFYQMMHIQGVNLNILTKETLNDETPLYLALEDWYESKYIKDIVFAFLRFGFNINSSIYKNDPFIITVAEAADEWSFFEKLCKMYELNFDFEDEEGNNFLHCVFLRGQKNIYESIISYIKQYQKNFLSKNIEKSKYKKIPISEKQYYDLINLFIKQNIKGDLPMVYASFCGISNLRDYIKIMADSDDPNVLVYKNASHLLEFLYYKVINNRFSHFSIFNEESLLDLSELLMLPIKYHSFDITLCSQPKLETLLHIFSKYPFIFKVLNSSEIDFFKLLYRIIIKSKEIFNQFKKIDLLHLNYKNKTCLELAVENKNLYMIKLLKKLGYNFSYINPETNKTILHVLSDKIIDYYRFSGSLIEHGPGTYHNICSMYNTIMSTPNSHRLINIRDKNDERPIDIFIRKFQELKNDSGSTGRWERKKIIFKVFKNYLRIKKLLTTPKKSLNDNNSKFN